MPGREATRRQTITSQVPVTGPAGEFLVRGDEVWYRIAAADRLRPFLMSLASDCDLWMFVTSRGGLTCGRVDAEGAIFPYLTVDRLHDAHRHTGPVTMLRVPVQGAEPVVWEPFAAAGDDDPAIDRFLEKNATGNRLVFEEVHTGLGLAFRYQWASAQRFGWVRTAQLVNRGERPVRVDVLDGVRNVLPWGVPLSLYQQASNLVDAYRRSEIEPETGLGIFSLTAGITDRPEAVEVLRANVVWCCGREDFKVHLQDDALRQFRRGAVMSGDRILNGDRGNYIISFEADLQPREASSWRLVCDVGLDHARLAEVLNLARVGDAAEEAVDQDLKRSQADLRGLVASADGLQLTAGTGAWTHHYTNTLFNIMRGGVFVDNYAVPREDFRDFLGVRNAGVLQAHESWLRGLPEAVGSDRLLTEGKARGDADLVRLILEYLPLHFGRRHGDPSRPWNRFSIHVRDDAGRPLLRYEGNWRDIFQNWEALATAFPMFLPHMVAKFVNASTVDGFNPYRLNRDGVEWETSDPDHPWSNIGYWGDHQIVYLTRLLKAWDRYDSTGIEDMLDREVFSYAEVPYRLKSFAEILADPADSIVFDHELDRTIADRVEREGTDGKLLHAAAGEVVLVSLLEKLLVPVLSKLSNLVPDGGIWMNTQRPEWNDANNALAGPGLSVVTLAYLRSHLDFLAGMLERNPQRTCSVSSEVGGWFTSLDRIYAQGPARRDHAGRMRFLEDLGTAFEDFRRGVYDHGLSGTREPLQAGKVAAFLRRALAEVDRSLAANRRPDSLYHAYNLLQTQEGRDGLRIGRLPEMLEGQVAILNAGVLDAEKTLALLRSLYASDLYRPDQDSFLLYPDRRQPGFLDRNRIPAAAVESIALLRDLLADPANPLVRRDADGSYHFHPDLVRGEDLENALEQLAVRPGLAAAVARDRLAVLDLYESVFHHRSYTGRSGTMHGYEGLGCIYWHMVAKLLLAVQETLFRGRQAGWDRSSLGELAGLYHRVRQGLGYRKSVTEFGAFPGDPYSHTPGDGGARQPGMTGQVKEEILTRQGELGLRVTEGSLRFEPVLLEKSEFLAAPGEFLYYDRDGRRQVLPLQPGELAFTVCQTPVVYQLDSGPGVVIATYNDGVTEVRGDGGLGVSLSRHIFHRTGRIALIRVLIPEDTLGRM